MIAIVIKIVYFKPYKLILLEVVVNLEKLQKVRVQIVPHGLSAAQTLPDRFVLRLEEHHRKGVRLANS